MINNNDVIPYWVHWKILSPLTPLYRKSEVEVTHREHLWEWQLVTVSLKDTQWHFRAADASQQGGLTATYLRSSSKILKSQRFLSGRLDGCLSSSMQRAWQPPHRSTPTCKAIMTIVRPIITVMQQGGKTGLIASFEVPRRFTVYKMMASRGKGWGEVGGTERQVFNKVISFPMLLSPRSHFLSLWFNWVEGKAGRRRQRWRGFLSHFVYLIAAGVGVGF